MSPLISELVDLLSAGTFTPEEQDAIVQEIEEALPELDWTSSEDQAYAIAITTMMRRKSASGDKINEIHEDICKMMGDGFPTYPRESMDVPGYFIWLDSQLSEWKTDEVCDIVEIDDTITDNMHLFAVYRKDIARILEIAASLDLSIRRPIDYWRKLGFA